MKNGRERKISVITPSLDSARFLEQAIQSVRDQDYQAVEHIIVDGGSSDETVEILKKNPHLIWISEPDSGQSDAMNKGFLMSSGEIVVYLNADDFFLLGAFHAVIKVFEENPSIDFCVGKCKMICSDGKSGINDPKTDFFDMIKWWENDAYAINSGTYFYRRTVQETIEGFDVNKHHSLDYCFLLRARLRFSFHKLDRVLNCFRYIPGTKTFETRGEAQYPSKFWFVKDYLKHLSNDQLETMKDSFRQILGKDNVLYHHYFAG